MKLVDSRGSLISDNGSRNGKNRTYFGATGCDKSFNILFLARLLMKNDAFGSPTII